LGVNLEVESAIQSSTAGQHAMHDHTRAEAMDRAVHGREVEHAEHAGGHAAHVDHTGHEAMFRRRFWICLILTIPVLLFSPLIQEWFGFRRGW